MDAKTKFHTDRMGLFVAVVLTHGTLLLPHQNVFVAGAVSVLFGLVLPVLYGLGTRSSMISNRWILPLVILISAFLVCAPSIVYPDKSFRSEMAIVVLADLGLLNAGYGR